MKTKIIRSLLLLLTCAMLLGAFCGCGKSTDSIDDYYVGEPYVVNGELIGYSVIVQFDKAVSETPPEPSYFHPTMVRRVTMATMQSKESCLTLLVELNTNDDATVLELREYLQTVEGVSYVGTSAWDHGNNWGLFS